MPILGLDDVVEILEAKTAVLNFIDPTMALIEEIHNPASQFSRLERPLRNNPPLYIANVLPTVHGHRDVITVAYRFYLVLEYISRQNCSFIEAIIEDRINMAFVFSKNVEPDKLRGFNNALTEQYAQVGCLSFLICILQTFPFFHSSNFVVYFLRCRNVWSTLLCLIFLTMFFFR